MPERLALPPYPRGWYAVALSSELPPGGVLTRKYFGRELVIFRAMDGTACVSDAYCPHLGAHLGHGGVVDGDSIVCPFHGWRFGSDGACTAMPYGQRIPSRARLDVLPVSETNGVVHAYHDPEGLPAPDCWIPEFDASGWTPTIALEVEVGTHPQEVAENAADFAHFHFIHATPMVRAVEGPSVEGPVYSVTIESDPEAVHPEYRLEDTGFGMHQVATVYGPGLTIAVTTGPDEVTSWARLYVTPIDGERSAMRGLCSVEVFGEDADACTAYNEMLAKEVFKQWQHDIPIWEHKRYRAEPAINEMEGAVAVYRRFMRQFYPKDFVASG